jgi:carbamoyltransferase
VDLNGGYTGRQYSDGEIEAALFSAKGRIFYRREENIAGKVAQRLANGEIVAWFQGRSEFGPRALGARSILADPTSADVIERLNKVIKRREWFQPIAPSVIIEACERYFLIKDDPFMCIAAEAKPETLRSAPGIVHKDGTSRVHTVERKINPLYYQLLESFYELTGLPMVANTSFNGKGEPMVETPLEAVETMLRTQLDGLAIGSFFVTRKSGIK